MTLQLAGGAVADVAGSIQILVPDVLVDPLLGVCRVVQGFCDDSVVHDLGDDVLVGEAGVSKYTRGPVYSRMTAGFSNTLSWS